MKAGHIGETNIEGNELPIRYSTRRVPQGLIRQSYSKHLIVVYHLWFIF